MVAEAGQGHLWGELTRRGPRGRLRYRSELDLHAGAITPGEKRVLT